jgi:hypothetical protein
MTATAATGATATAAVAEHVADYGDAMTPVGVL